MASLKQNYSNLQKQKLVHQCLQTPSSRGKLAASMINPIRQRISHFSIAKRILSVESIPAGALPIYDSPKGMVWRYHDPNLQGAIGLQSGGGRFIVPRFTNSEQIDISIKTIKNANKAYPLLQNLVDAGMKNLSNSLDEHLLALMNDASGPQDDLSSICDYLEDPKFLVFNPEDKSAPALSLPSGSQYSLEPITSDVVPRGQAYVCGTDFGVLPITTQLTILSSDHPPTTVGFYMFEDLGMAVIKNRVIKMIFDEKEKQIEIIFKIIPI